MALTDRALWNRLMAFQYGTPEAGGLVDRVMGALGLGKREAQRRVDGYLRFMYLVAASDEVLAPSRPVDDVWHLHLEDRRAYEDQFCKPVLGRVIHHHEGRPSPARDPAYQRTLIRYREEFDRKPEPPLWPVPARPVATPIATMGLGALGIIVGSVAAAPFFFMVGGAICLMGFLLLTRNLGPGGVNSGCGGVFSGDGSGDAGGSSDGGGGDGGGGGCGGD